MLVELFMKIYEFSLTCDLSMKVLIYLVLPCLQQS